MRPQQSRTSRSAPGAVGARFFTHSDSERAAVIATDELGISFEEECLAEGAFVFEGLPHGRWSLTAAVVDEGAAFATREPRVLEIGRASDLPEFRLEPAARVAVFVDLSGDDVESRGLAKMLAKIDDNREKKWGRVFRDALRREGSDVMIPVELLPEITARHRNGAQEFGVLLPVPPGRWNLDVSIDGRKLFGGRCDVKFRESTTLTVKRL